MAVLIGIGVAAVIGGYLCHVPKLIANAILFGHEDKLVNNLKDLQKGDHILFKKSGPKPSHHAIVIDVNETEMTYTIIHFRSINNSNNSTCKRTASVVKETKPFREGQITLRDYKKKKRFCKEKTIMRAQILLEKQGKIDYNLLTNNCEHVAMWCLSGFGWSQQNENVNAMLGPVGLFFEINQALNSYLRDGDPAK